MPTVDAAADPLKAFYDYLIADAALAALIGQRLYPEVAPKDTAHPYCVYQQIFGAAAQELIQAAPMERLSIQIRTQALTGPSRGAVAEAIRDALDGFRGIWGELGVLSSRVSGTIHSWEQLEDGSDKGIFVAVQQVDVWRLAVTPTFP